MGVSPNIYFLIGSKCEIEYEELWWGEGNAMFKV